MKFGILAPGGIAHSMAKTIKEIPGVECYAVASRSLERAEAFAEQWGFEKAYGSYEELAKDPEVDLIYVASPHSHHYEHAKMCLENGKPVLVEKAFTVNAAQAEELIELSKKNNVLLAEAIWTRYMPSRKMLNDLLEQGVIGEVTSLSANLGLNLEQVERMQSPELAGGALLDLSVYPITIALMVFKGNVKTIDSSAVMSPRGVDWMNTITLTFDDGKLASLYSNMLAVTDRQAIISGSKGCIKIQDINNFKEIQVYNKDLELTDTYEVPKQITGYEYEVLACMKALEEGRIECPEMPHSESLRVMKLMDAVRAKWGLTYPCE